MVVWKPDNHYVFPTFLENLTTTVGSHWQHCLGARRVFSRCIVLLTGRWSRARIFDVDECNPTDNTFLCVCTFDPCYVEQTAVGNRSLVARNQSNSSQTSSTPAADLSSRGPPMFCTYIQRKPDRLWGLWVSCWHPLVVLYIFSRWRSSINSDRASPHARDIHTCTRAHARNLDRVRMISFIVQCTHA